MPCTNTLVPVCWDYCPPIVPGSCLYQGQVQPCGLFHKLSMWAWTGYLPLWVNVFSFAIWRSWAGWLPRSSVAPQHSKILDFIWLRHYFQKRNFLIIYVRGKSALTMWLREGMLTPSLLGGQDGRPSAAPLSGARPLAILHPELRPTPQSVHELQVAWSHRKLGFPSLLPNGSP